jgi:hypothetical protein
MDMGKMRNSYNIWLETRKEETSWSNKASMRDNIKMNLGAVGLKGIYWLHVAQNRD